MGYPRVYDVVVRIALNAEELECIEWMRQLVVYGDGESPTIDEVVGTWAQVAVEDRIVRERCRRDNEIDRAEHR